MSTIMTVKSDPISVNSGIQYTGSLFSVGSGINTIVETTTNPLIDSYSESNQDEYQALYNGSVISAGQSFLNTNSIVLDKCKFFLRKSGSPTGNAVAKIYAHTGTFGTTGKPTGAVLATSDNFDVSTLTTTYTLKTFTFTGDNKITLSASTNYCIEVEYTGGSGLNYVLVGQDYTSPTHLGIANYSEDGINWDVLTRDCCFYIYGDSVTSYSWNPPGNINLSVVASGISGDISSGISGGNQITQLWSRQEIDFQMPHGVVSAYLRADVTVRSGCSVFIDCAQLERGDITNYNDNFIGDKLLPKRPSRIVIDLDDTQYPIFSGVTETIEPNNLDETTHIYLHDIGSELLDKKIPSGMYQSIRTSDAVLRVCDALGMASGTFNVDTGEKTIDFMWFQDGSAWYYLSNIAEAEGGRVFFDGDGILNFWNHSHVVGITSGTPTKYFDFSDSKDFSWRIDKDQIYNDIVIKSTPRKVMPYTEVYDHNTYETLDPGESRSIVMNFTDPDRNNEGMPTIGVKQPTTGITNDSYYQVRPNSDGTGANRDSDVTITFWSAESQSATIRFQNNSVDTLYVTELHLYAAPVKVQQIINIQEEDTDSIAIYGRRTLQLENDFFNNRTSLELLASQKLAEQKDPRTHLKVSIVGDPSLKLGDIVTVQDAYDDKVNGVLTEYGTTQNLMVKSIRWQLDGELTQDIEFEKSIYSV